MTETLFDELRPRLVEALAGARRVAVLGCGSSLRGDDGLGALVAERLADTQLIREQFDGMRASARIGVFRGDTAPENFSGEIKNFGPDVLLVVDTANMGLPPGTAALIPTEEIGGVSFSTHRLPLRIMLDYLRRETGCRVYLLCVQGATLAFGADMTPEVLSSADMVTFLLFDLLKYIGREK